MQTKKTIKSVLWILFALAALGVSLYPAAYVSSGFREAGLLSSKSQELRTNTAFLTAFYIHISFGALALLTGWSQFLKSWRAKHLKFHRSLGYIYVISVLISSIAGFIIALSSTGGTVAAFGFGGLAVFWFITNLLAFFTIKQGKVKEHEKWMMRNYALTFAAVTLRIYLPISLGIGASIELTLKIVSWLCWIPNIVMMEIYIRTQHGQGAILVQKSEQKQEAVKAQGSISPETCDHVRKST